MSYDENKLTEFQERALNYLAGPMGDRRELVMVGALLEEGVSLRECWTPELLLLWEEEEGEEATGLPTWEHWKSYVFGD